jgi:hypothetical protein
LPAGKNPTAKPEPTLASATAKTQSVIENLQARLKSDSANRPHAQIQSLPMKQTHDADDFETDEDLERQLQAYFANATIASRAGASAGQMPRIQSLDLLQTRVVDGVVHRILADWARREQESPGSAALGAVIMDRLIQRVLEQFQEIALAS